jgi:hypothetical protein
MTASSPTNMTGWRLWHLEILVKYPLLFCSVGREIRQPKHKSYA